MNRIIKGVNKSTPKGVTSNSFLVILGKIGGFENVKVSYQQYNSNWVISGKPKVKVIARKKLDKPFSNNENDMMVALKVYLINTEGWQFIKVLDYWEFD